MPSNAARTSARELARKSARQTATRSRARASQDTSNLLNASSNSDNGDDDHVAHDATETTNLQSSALPSDIFTSVSRSETVDHAKEGTSPAIPVQDDSSLGRDQAESLQAESGHYFPGGPLNWDWEGAEDFQDIAQNYEPQGELLKETEDRRAVGQDFDFREVTTDSPQIQSYFSNLAKASAFDFTQLAEQPSARQQPQSTGSRQGTSLNAREKRKSVVAIETDLDGTQGDSSAKRVAVSPEESGGASGQISTDRPTQHYQNGGILRRASGVPEPDRPQAEASQNRPTTQHEVSGKRSKTSNRRDRLDKKKMALPAGKVFPIQIGSELFRLSGASLSSDAPSYFSDFFGEQLRSAENAAANVKTLYIDRDPITFRDISLHLQGYHVQPRDGEHFVRLFADAQFYSLPRLITQLYTSTIFIQIGDRHFQIPRDIFNAPGDTPNYFSLGFAVFFSTPNEVFPGLDQRGLLRPPSIIPPAVLNRSAEVFTELLQVLQGYPIHIRNDEHRAALLRDARYFHLKGVEQKLIPHHISFNYARQHMEIVIRLEDIRQSGVSFVSDSHAPAPSDQTTGTSPAEGDSSGPASRPSPAASSTSNSNPAGRASSTVGPTTQIHPGVGWIHYARPYVDDTPYQLVLEIGGEGTRLDLGVTPPRAAFTGRTNDRVSALLGVVASKMNLPATGQPLGLMMLQSGGGVATQPVSPGMSGLSEERMKVIMDPTAAISVDGVAWDPVVPPLESTVGFEPEEFEAIFEFEGREGRGRARRRRRAGADDESGAAGGGMTGVEGGGNKVWVVRNGHWRLRAQQDGRGGVEVVLVAVKLEAYTAEKVRNSHRGFLS